MEQERTRNRAVQAKVSEKKEGQAANEHMCLITAGSHGIRGLVVFLG